jgi:hypothetical protein
MAEQLESDVLDWAVLRNGTTRDDTGLALQALEM